MEADCPILMIPSLHNLHSNNLEAFLFECNFKFGFFCSVCLPMQRRKERLPEKAECWSAFEPSKLGSRTSCLVSRAAFLLVTRWSCPLLELIAKRSRRRATTPPCKFRFCHVNSKMEEQAFH